MSSGLGERSALRPSAIRRRWLVGLSAAVVVLPWVVLVFASGEELSMARAAVPSHGSTLDAAVAPFASAPFFLLVDLESSSVEVIENLYADPEALGMKAAFLLLRAGAGVVLAAKIGAEPRNLLLARGAQLYATQGATAREAVLELSAGVAAKLGPVSPTGDAPTNSAAQTCPVCPAPPRCDLALAPPLSVTARSSGALTTAAPPPYVPPPPVTTSQLAAMAGSYAASPGLVAPSMVAMLPAARPNATIPANFELRLTTLAGVGAQVLSVQAGSRAQWAGFKPGDIIVKVGQTLIRSAEQVEQLLSRIPPDQNAAVRVLRHDGAVERLLVIGGAQLTVGASAIPR